MLRRQYSEVGRVRINASQFVNRDAFLKYAIQKGTKSTKITMEVLYAYFSRMLHVCYAYSSRMLRILLVAYSSCMLCVFFAYVIRIIFAYDMRILRICYA